jgi:hypothetical protein
VPASSPHVIKQYDDELIGAADTHDVPGPHTASPASVQSTVHRSNLPPSPASVERARELVQTPSHDAGGVADDATACA